MSEQITRAEYEKSIAEVRASIPTALGDYIKGLSDDEKSITSAELREAVKKAEQNVQAVVDKQSTRIKELENRRWENSENRIRVRASGNVYDEGSISETSTAFAMGMTGSGAQGKSGQEALEKTAESLKGNAEAIEAHFDAIEKRSPNKKLDLVQMNMRDGLLGRLDDNQKMFNSTAKSLDKSDKRALLGDNADFINPIESSEIWSEVTSEDNMLSRLYVYPMSTGTQKVPLWGNQLWKGMKKIDTGSPGENAVRSTDAVFTTSHVDVESKEAIMPSFVQQSLIEDSIVPMPGEHLRKLGEDFRTGMEDAVLNGEDGATTLNGDGAGNDLPGGGSKLFDGVRKLADGDASAQVNVNAALTFDTFADLAAKLGMAGVTAGSFFYVMGPTEYNKARYLEEFRDYINFAALHTSLTGELPAIGRSELVVAETMWYGFQATGRHSATPGDNDTGAILAVSIPLTVLGMRIPPQVMSQTLINPTGVDVIARARFGFKARGNLPTNQKAVALARNITR